MHCFIKFVTFVCCKYSVFLGLSFSGCKNLQLGLVQTPAMCAKQDMAGAIAVFLFQLLLCSSF